MVKNVLSLLRDDQLDLIPTRATKKQLINAFIQIQKNEPENKKLNKELDKAIQNLSS